MTLQKALVVTLITLLVVVVVFGIFPHIRKLVDGDPVPDRPLRGKEDQAED